MSRKAEFKDAADMIEECRNTNRRTAKIGATTVAEEFGFIWGMLSCPQNIGCSTVQQGIIDGERCLMSPKLSELMKIITYLEEYGRNNDKFVINVYTDGWYALFCGT